MIQKFDERNKNIKIWINGELLHRNDAKISVFDSAVQGGDAVWEGIRVYNGRIFCFKEHLNRLLESAKSMNFLDVPSLQEIRNAIFSIFKCCNIFFQCTTSWICCSRVFKPHIFTRFLLNIC